MNNAVIGNERYNKTKIVILDDTNILCKYHLAIDEFEKYINSIPVIERPRYVE